MTFAPESSPADTPSHGPSSNVDWGASAVPSDVLLSLRGISKSFGPVQAIQNINLDIPAGKVTAVIGDNGAGKSTLIKTISGIWSPSSGHMYWNGKEVHIHSPRDAAELGIATVYQDLALCDNLDIVQNLFLGRELVKYRVLDESGMETQAKHTLAD